MPFFDFRFSDQSGATAAQRHAVRALDLEEAKQEALSWVEAWRRSSSEIADRSACLLVISLGEDTEAERRGTAVYARIGI